MTRTSAIKSKRYLSAKLAAGLAISAFLVLGNFVASANAQEHRDDQRSGDGPGDRGHRDREPHDRGHGDRYWDGDYYRAPPVVYSTPYYYPPPPVVYGPAIGVYLPGINIEIR